MWHVITTAPPSLHAFRPSPACLAVTRDQFGGTAVVIGVGSRIRADGCVGILSSISVALDGRHVSKRGSGT